MNDKELLKKYIQHVYDCEGIDFIRYLAEDEEYKRFSREEIEELKLLSKEINS